MQPPVVPRRVRVMWSYMDELGAGQLPTLYEKLCLSIYDPLQWCSFPGEKNITKEEEVSNRRNVVSIILCRHFRPLFALSKVNQRNSSALKLCARHNRQRIIHRYEWRESPVAYDWTMMCARRMDAPELILLRQYVWTFLTYTATGSYVNARVFASANAHATQESI